MKKVYPKILTDPGRNKTLVFKTIAVLLPLMLILLLEAILRLFGYGHDLQLFTNDDKNNGFWVMNPHASKRYFAQEENATIGTFESFAKRKTAGTFRIFVLGESTTLGYPYMYNASFHRWLNYRLMHTFPDRQFEIVNLSLTAVNSYTILGFTKELIRYSPDAVLIYCGQNEYYGTLGVGSTSRFGSSRFLIQGMIYLRSFRLVQFIGNNISHIKSAFRSKQVKTRETLMRLMAADQEIAYNSSVYLKGIRQFQKNMDEVCTILSRNNIQVYISNLVSNEKDLRPFISNKSDTSSSADYYFSRAEKAYSDGDFEQAKQLYVRAKDLDMLRFRAPDTLNKIISGLPLKFPSVYLVDTRKIFERYSPHGIIGKETILEHVHPNIFGYALMSEAFYQTMKQHHLLSFERDNEITMEQLLKEMPITKVDSLKGTYEIMVLKENWPFNEKKNFDRMQMKLYEEKMAVALLDHKLTWNDAMQQLMNYYLNQNKQADAAKVAESVALQYANDATFLYYAGKFCMKQHRYKRAKVYFHNAFRFAPNFELAQELAILFLKTDDPGKAIHFLNYLVQNNHSKVNFSPVQSLTNELVGYKIELSKDSTNVDLLNQIAFNYFQMQNVDVAKQYSEKALKIDNRNKTASEMLLKIQSLAVDIH